MTAPDGFCRADVEVHVRYCTCAGTAPGWPQHESFCGTDVGPCGRELRDGVCPNRAAHIDEQAVA